MTDPLTIARRAVAAVLLGMGMLVIGGRNATGQDLPVRTLTRPEVEYGEPFTALVGVRELPDGRIIVGDRIERTLQVIDLRSGSARQIGREGEGPQEYGIPSRVIELGGDSTLIHDSGNARFLLLVGGDRIVGTLPLETSSGDRLIGPPAAWDAVGGLYYHDDVYPPGPPRMDATPVHALIWRYDRATRGVDTVTKLALPPGRSQGVRQLEGGMVRVLDNMPMAAEDVAAVARDGRVAVVRSAPYRVEWVHRDGRRVTGPTVSYTPLRISDDDKRAYLRRQVRPGNIIVIRQGGADAKAAPIQRSGRRPPPDEPDIDDPSLTWPTNMPPFLAGAARVAPDGTLWVLRTRAHDDDKPTYDLFDGAGRLTGRIVLPPHTRLLGFGKGTVYLIRVDADELQWIQRYRL